jgi:hypothetical protein
MLRPTEEEKEQIMNEYKKSKRIKDFGDLCIYCDKDTSFGSGRFVNRIPTEIETEEGQIINGYECSEGQEIHGYECDECYTKWYEEDGKWEEIEIDSQS